MASIVLNLLIVGMTVAAVILVTRENGKWVPARLRKAPRYFTFLSNVYCAAASLLMAVSALSGDVPEWIWILKYIGTVALTVTMLTVFLFLAPSIGKGWVKILLGGHDLFMHVLTPVAALISFCVFEKRGMSFAQSLWGLLPVALYGPLYLYRILYAPKEKRWDDFYGFNRKGNNWPISYACMLVGTFLICMALMAIQNA